MHTSRNRLSAALAILGAGLAQFAGSATDRVLAAAGARNARPPRRRETSRVLAYWGRSKYTPHQGKRERLRRRIGGFAGVANHAEDLGITRAEVVRRIDECVNANRVHQEVSSDGR